MSASVLAAALTLLSTLQGHVHALDNGLGLKPPMGWRSWNFYGLNVDQALMMRIMDGMAARKRTVDGVPMSLCDVGYCDCGLDDNWQLCGSYGPSAYTMHTEAGTPVVNRSRFPDMLQMTDHAHSLGLTAGWYLNNCICLDHCGNSKDGPNGETNDKCYRGDAAALKLFNFDSVKLDMCGAQNDLGLWAKIFNESGKPIMIENCHWGKTVPTKDYCPFNFYRTSDDIRAVYSSIVKNLNSVQKFAEQGLSYPGCYAYPDQLQVGCKNGAGHAKDVGLNVNETKTHFAGWCIVSSPLTLAMDVNNDTIMDEVWPIITNKIALRVNQEYNGYSGGTFYADPVKTVISDRGGVVEAPSYQYMYKPLLNNDIAVLIINHELTARNLALDVATIPGIVSGHTYGVREVWSGKIIQTAVAPGTTVNQSIPSHGSGFYVLEY